MTKTNLETIAAMHLARAIDSFADYLHGISPGLSHAESVILMASIVGALPALYEANPPMRNAVDDLVSEIRGGRRDN